MKQAFTIVMAALVLAGISGTDTYAGQRKGLNAALVPSVQIYNDQAEMTGLRLNLVGNNLSMTGLDLGAVNMVEERFTGLALGLGNAVEGKTYGLQLGAFNYAGDLRGVQIGAFNRAGQVEGVQIGIANHSHENNRLQLGLVNVASNRHGWQIGLMNFNLDAAASFSGMIFVNGAF